MSTPSAAELIRACLVADGPSATVAHNDRGVKELGRRTSGLVIADLAPADGVVDEPIRYRGNAGDLFVEFMTQLAMGVSDPGSGKRDRLIEVNR